MEIEKIYDEDGAGFTRVFRDNDVELVDPIIHFMNHSINVSISMEKDLIAMKNPKLAEKLEDSFYIKRAMESWNERLDKINQTAVPSNFISLLEGKSKKEQIRLLRGENLTTDQLIAFIFRAFTEFGFLFSNYRSEHHHKGLDVEDLPKLIEINGDEVRTVGETSLTEGQLKNVIIIGK